MAILALILKINYISLEGLAYNISANSDQELEELELQEGGGG
jgi:hypothetical protein